MGTITFFLVAIDLAVVAVGVYYVLTHPREPRAMLAWILTFLLLPLFGVLLFFFLSDPKLNRRRRRFARRRQRLKPELWKKLHSFHRAYCPKLANQLPELRKFVELATRVNNQQPPTSENAVTVFHNNARKVREQLQQTIANAKHHVHLEYFVFKADRSGELIAETLISKALQGVKCRLLIDHLGSWGWPTSFQQKLQSAGVEVAFFMPVLPWRGHRWRMRLNFRNHRKIVIVDGVIAFTGSQNIGDEYFGFVPNASGWIDTHLRLTGPSVYELQETFMEDWHFATGEDLFAEVYFPPPQVHPKDDQIVQIIPSGPDYDAQIMHHLLLAAISAADTSVCIATPYFVPDMTMVLTLEAAAYRGVNVKLLLPVKSDHRLALWAGRSYYRELNEAGIEIYEFEHNFLHSKLVIIDKNWGMVGSANMDERSFKLNFEITTVIYSQVPVRQLQREFDAMLQNSRRVDPTTKPRRFLNGLQLGFARLVSPLY